MDQKFNEASRPNVVASLLNKARLLLASNLFEARDRSDDIVAFFQ